MLLSVIAYIFFFPLDNPLVVSFDTASDIRAKKTKQWFSKPIFDNLETDVDMESGVTATAQSGAVDSMEVDDTSSSDDDEQNDGNAKKKAKKTSRSDKSSSKDSFEVVPVISNKRKLDPEGLAIGALLTQSKKKREDLVESGYNRWTHNDENLPDWFVESEAKFCQKRLPITKEMVEVYRAKLKEINDRPIKKVAEAKARKKKRVMKTMEKARKKAESIVESEDVSSQEKAQQLKQIYKKAGVFGTKKKKKENVEYVVAKRGMGKKVRRPAGVKGRYKVVDPRMKKDTLGMAKDRKQREGRGKKKEKGKKGGERRGGGKRKR